MLGHGRARSHRQCISSLSWIFTKPRMDSYRIVPAALDALEMRSRKKTARFLITLCCMETDDKLAGHRGISSNDPGFMSALVPFLAMGIQLSFMAVRMPESSTMKAEVALSGDIY